MQPFFDVLEILFRVPLFSDAVTQPTILLLQVFDLLVETIRRRKQLRLGILQLDPQPLDLVLELRVLGRQQVVLAIGHVKVRLSLQQLLLPVLCEPLKPDRLLIAKVRLERRGRNRTPSRRLRRV